MDDADPHAHSETKRKEISSIFITLLVGLAFAESVPPIREAIRTEGFTFGTAMLGISFFLTSTRWLIGGWAHLIDPKNHGWAWFTDFLLITLQTMILVFMGGLVSSRADAQARVDYTTLLLWLLGSDVVWLLVRRLGHGFAQRRSASPLPPLPMRWAYLNLAVIVVLLAARRFAGDHTITTYAVLGIASVIAFVLDVLVFDYSRLLKPASRQPSAEGAQPTGRQPAK